MGNKLSFNKINVTNYFNKNNLISYFNKFDLIKNSYLIKNSDLIKNTNLIKNYKNSNNFNKITSLNKLGRWTNKNNKQTEISEYWTNIDHCGDKVCGDLQKTKEFYEKEILKVKK
jgi:hypothetical protein